MPTSNICAYCKNPYIITHHSPNTAQFCSRVCRDNARRDSLILTCKHYKKPFQVKAYRKDTALYCSRACKYAGSDMTGAIEASMLARRGKGLRTFWDKVEQCEHGYDCPFCCWPFNGGLTNNGYGRVKIENGMYRGANRVAWELHNGRKMPDDLFAAHYCHFPACSNFDHIHAATQKENMADSVRDRRHYHGERHHNSKLTKESIQEAFALRAQGWIIQRIADHLNVSYIVIQKLLKGDTWKYIDFDAP